MLKTTKDLEQITQQKSSLVADFPIRNLIDASTLLLPIEEW